MKTPFPWLLLRSVILMSMLFGAGKCIAGGLDWQVNVRRLEFDESGDFVVDLIPIANQLGFPGACSVLTISGGYSRFRWFFLGTDKMTFESHMYALRFLASNQGQSVVVFGKIGSGLAMVQGEKCKAISRGLMLVNDGDSAVYTYYKWP